MKIIGIKGDNYFGSFRESRSACRAVVIEDGKMLLSYQTKDGKFMLPGGGIEADESDAECCVREVEEETGYLVEPEVCFLEIDEFYEDVRYVNRYLVCRVVGTGERKPTATETALGMEPRLVPIGDAMAIFGSHSVYADTDEKRRGVYFREYTALCELENLGENFLSPKEGKDV